MSTHSLGLSGAVIRAVRIRSSKRVCGQEPAEYIQCCGRKNQHPRFLMASLYLLPRHFACVLCSSGQSCFEIWTTDTPSHFDSNRSALYGEQSTMINGTPGAKASAALTATWKSCPFEGKLDFQFLSEEELTAWKAKCGLWMEVCLGSRKFFPSPVISEALLSTTAISHRSVFLLLFDRCCGFLSWLPWPYGDSRPGWIGLEVNSKGQREGLTEALGRC